MYAPRIHTDSAPVINDGDVPEMAVLQPAPQLPCCRLFYPSSLLFSPSLLPSPSLIPSRHPRVTDSPYARGEGWRTGWRAARLMYSIDHGVSGNRQTTTIVFTAAFTVVMPVHRCRLYILLVFVCTHPSIIHHLTLRAISNIYRIASAPLPNHIINITSYSMQKT